MEVQSVCFLLILSSVLLSSASYGPLFTLKTHIPTYNEKHKLKEIKSFEFQSKINAYKCRNCPVESLNMVLWVITKNIGPFFIYVMNYLL